LAGFTFELPDFSRPGPVCRGYGGPRARRPWRKSPRRQPDLLLLDHKLPGISGLEILQRLHRKEQPDHHHHDHRLRLVSNTAVAATKCGAYDFLAKPFTPAELKASVRQSERLLL
jgi:DNA-binding response OmpR family regulator